MRGAETRDTETKEEFLEMVRLYLLFEESELLPDYSSDKTVNAMLKLLPRVLKYKSPNAK